MKIVGPPAKVWAKIIKIRPDAQFTLEGIIIPGLGLLRRGSGIAGDQRWFWCWWTTKKDADYKDIEGKGRNNSMARRISFKGREIKRTKSQVKEDLLDALEERTKIILEHIQMSMDLSTLLVHLDRYLENVHLIKQALKEL